MHPTGIEFFIHANPIIAYAIIFLGVVIEGDGTVLFASVFAWQGLISWPLLGAVVIIAGIAGDIFWYSAGKYLKGTKLGCWLDKHYEKAGGSAILEKVMARYHWYAVLNKFMYFTTKPTVFLVGWHDFEFKKFLRITTYATIIWAIILLIIGFGFGYTIHLIGFKRIVHRIEIFAAILFIGIFILEWGIKKIVKKAEKRMR